MSTLFRDLRYALRALQNGPSFAAVAVLTVALGIGANTAIFTLVNAVMLKPLPVEKPHELFRVGSGDNCCVIGGMQHNWGIFSYALYQQFRNHTPEFVEMTAFQGGLQNSSVRRGGSTEAGVPYISEFVSGNYFETFGIGAFAGRMISPDDDQQGAPPVLVMSYRAWKQNFGMDPNLVGATLMVDDVAFTVAGIAPPGFFGDTLRPDPPDLWLPIFTEPAIEGKDGLLNRTDSHWLYIIGRMRPGNQAARVQSAMTAQLQHWLAARDLDARERSELPQQKVNIVSAAGGISNLQGDYKSGFQLLIAISGLVLLIACANIANLLLARGAAARVQMAIRVALGAPRRRLIRQVLTESVLLAVLGGAAGVFVAFLGTRTILAIAFRGAHYVPISASPSWPVLGFAFLLSLSTGVIFGVAPAWITSHANPIDALRGAGRSTRDRTSLPRRALVVLQVALSAILLIGAGLLTQSLRNLENQNYGFEPQGRVVVRVAPNFTGYSEEKLAAAYRQLEEHLTQVEGVQSASFSLYSPMRGDNWSNNINIEGRSPEERDGASFDRVGPDYFKTIGTHLIRGRTFGEQDTPSSTFVTVINQTFARKYFPKIDPIGRHFGMGGTKHGLDYEVVGIVDDAKYQDAREPAYPTFFLPFGQVLHDPDSKWLIYSHYIGDIELHVAGSPQNLESIMRRTLAEVDPNITVLDVLSLPEQISRNFNQERLIARLTELFGLLALILACVGLYGVTSYTVSRRTNEIGIRMALGAERVNVIGLVLKGVLLQLAIGLALGIPITLAASRALASQLYGVKSYDPLIIGAAALLLALCAFAAGFVPARRAASIDPMIALRFE